MEEAEIAEVGDGPVSRLDGDDELSQLHWLRPEQIHRRPAISSVPPHRLSDAFTECGRAATVKRRIAGDARGAEIGATSPAKRRSVGRWSSTIQPRA